MIRVDLHIHTALSACGEDIMSPRRIFQRAFENGLDIIALTDHNATANLPAAEVVSRNFPALTFVPGMELTTVEEVHLLALFNNIEAALDLQKLVDLNLPQIPNDPALFGHQLIYDADDEIIDIDESFRQAGTDLSLDAAVKAIHDRGGLAVPAHVLRTKFSLISQLGFIPDAEFDAVELSWRDWIKRDYQSGDMMDGYVVVTGSDSHFVEDVGRVAMSVADDDSPLAELIRRLF